MSTAAATAPPESLLVAESAVEWPTVRALLARVPPARTLIVAESAWAELAQLPAAVGLLAVVAAPVPGVERAADFCLLLDGVQDPGNVGSMLRSAAAAGVAQVFMSPHCAFAWSPKVLRAGQGAHFHLAIFEGIDLGGWARAYRGKVVAMVAAEGTSLYDADLTGPVAIAIGNEGAGLSDDLVAAARLARHDSDAGRIRIAQRRGRRGDLAVRMCQAALARRRESRPVRDTLIAALNRRQEHRRERRILAAAAADIRRAEAAFDAERGRLDLVDCRRRRQPVRTHEAGSRNPVELADLLQVRPTRCMSIPLSL